MMKDVCITAFTQGGSTEGQLFAEASTLGWAVGEVPERVKVYAEDGTWESDYKLVFSGSDAFGYDLYAYSERSPKAERPNLHTPRRLLVLND